MGMAGAIKLKKVVQNTRNVLAIEALAAAQALDFMAPLKPNKLAQQAYAAVRAVSPKMEHDRSLASDFVKVAGVIKRGELARVLG
jgi:histidine ammonia-lyase